MRRINILILAAALLAIPASLGWAEDIYIDTVDVLLLESFPLQARVIVKGNLSTPCVKIGDPEVTKIENKFSIRLPTYTPEGMACIMVLAPFEQNIPLDIVGLPAGVYTVDVNGVAQTFELKTDNILGQPL